MTFHSILKNWITNGWVRFRLILSTPRSASTALELAFVNHEQVDFGILDPWDTYSFGRDRHNLADAPYEYIVRQILRRAKSSSPESLTAAFSDCQQSPLTIIIKEMTHQLSGHEHGADYGRQNFFRFLRLVDSPVVVNVRNPLLQIESRLLQVCHQVTREPDSRLIKYLQTQVKRVRDRDTEINYQNQLLDEWARKQTRSAHGGWLALVEFCQRTQQYAAIAPLLRIAFDISRNGWQQVTAQLNWLDESDIDYLVCDATLFRLEPRSILADLFAAMDLDSQAATDQFDAAILSSQISWGMPKFQDWYKRTQNSKGVQPPIEVPTTVQAFPSFMRGYVESSLQTYSRTIRNRKLVRPLQKQILEKLLGVKRSHRSYLRLTEESVIDPTELSLHEFLGESEMCYRVLQNKSLLLECEKSRSIPDQSPEKYMAEISKLERDNPAFGCIRMPLRTIDRQLSDFFTKSSALGTAQGCARTSSSLLVPEATAASASYGSNDTLGNVRSAMSSDVFVQIGATRDRLDPYLLAARARGMRAILVETPAYLDYRRALGGAPFDGIIAVQEPEKPEALLEVLQGIPNLRLILPGFERYVESSFEISRSLGHRAAATSLPIDKYQQRQALDVTEAGGVLQPAFLTVKIDTDPKELDLTGLTMPLVVKPVDGGGGLGVFLVESMDELKRAFTVLRKLRNYGGAEFSALILEEYIDGTEVSLQGIAREGRADLLSICEKQVGKEYNSTQTCGFRELGHVVRNEKHPDEFVSLADSCLRAFQYFNGPFHIDVIEQTGGRLSFLEMGFRLSGACIVDLLQRATGRSMADEVFACLLNDGKCIRQKPQHIRAVGQCLVASRACFRRAKATHLQGLEFEITEFKPEPKLNFDTIPSLAADVHRHSGFAGRVRVMGADWREVKTALEEFTRDIEGSTTCAE